MPNAVIFYFATYTAVGCHAYSKQRRISHLSIELFNEPDLPANMVNGSAKDCHHDLPKQLDVCTILRDQNAGPEYRTPPGYGIAVNPTDVLVLLVHHEPLTLIDASNMTTSSSGINVHMVTGEEAESIRPVKVFAMKYDNVPITLAPGEKSIHDMVCTIFGPIGLRLVSVFTHTHEFGTRVTGWKVNGDNDWHFLASVQHPDQKNIFIDTNRTDVALAAGDAIAVRCNYQNKQSES